MRADFDCESKRLLRDILMHFRRDGVTVDECAEAIGKAARKPLNPRTLRTYYEKDSKTKIDVDDLLSLSRFLAYEHGDTRIAEAFLPEGYAVVKISMDERPVTDVVCAIDECEGEALRDSRIGDYEGQEQMGRQIINEGASIVIDARRRRSA